MNSSTYLAQVARTLIETPQAPIREIAQWLQTARGSGRRVFVFGNGGSAATVSHIVNDLLKGTAHGGSPPLRVISLVDNLSTLTAFANDLGYETVFAGPLAALAEPGDIALALSGSGNSRNVLRAMQVAREKGLVCLGLTGCGGGDLQPLCDVCLVVPSDSMQVIEDVHLSVLHAIFLNLVEAL